MQQVVSILGRGMSTLYNNRPVAVKLFGGASQETVLASRQETRIRHPAGRVQSL
jgi:hypothetical protein